MEWLFFAKYCARHLEKVHMLKFNEGSARIFLCFCFYGMKSICLSYSGYFELTPLLAGLEHPDGPPGCPLLKPPRNSFTGQLRHC
jgi:hypothetical protein